MKRLRRPGYLAGYQPFGKTKGMMAQPPSPPPTEEVVGQTPQPVRPVVRPMAPVAPQAPMPAAPTIAPTQQADPVFLAQIAALQARIRKAGGRPSPAGLGPAAGPATQRQAAPAPPPAADEED